MTVVRIGGGYVGTVIGLGGEVDRVINQHLIAGLDAGQRLEVRLAEPDHHQVADHAGDIDHMPGGCTALESEGGPLETLSWEAFDSKRRRRLGPAVSELCHH